VVAPCVEADGVEMAERSVGGPDRQMNGALGLLRGLVDHFARRSSAVQREWRIDTLGARGILDPFVLSRPGISTIGAIDWPTGRMLP
jgi:hypothetical protein